MYTDDSTAIRLQASHVEASTILFHILSAIRLAYPPRQKSTGAPQCWSFLAVLVQVACCRLCPCSTQLYLAKPSQAKPILISAKQLVAWPTHYSTKLNWTIRFASFRETESIIPSPSVSSKPSLQRMPTVAAIGQHQRVERWHGRVTTQGEAHGRQKNMMLLLYYVIFNNVCPSIDIWCTVPPIDPCRWPKIDPNEWKE